MSTWRDIEEAATQRDAFGWPLTSPARTMVHHTIVLVQRGDLTREEALCSLALALLESHESIFAQLVEARSIQSQAPIIITREGIWRDDERTGFPLPGRTGQVIETHGSAPHMARDLCVGLGEDGLE